MLSANLTRANLVCRLPFFCFSHLLFVYLLLFFCTGLYPSLCFVDDFCTLDQIELKFYFAWLTEIVWFLAVINSHLVEGSWTRKTTYIFYPFS